MKKKWIMTGLSLLCIAGIASHLRSVSLPSSGSAHSGAFFPGAEAPPPRLRGLERPAAVRAVRKAFLAASDADGANVEAALATLSDGLLSRDESVRRTTARYVESLLVDVAHGQASPDRAQALRELFVSYKTHAPEQIQRMQAAFPASPTLAYLRQI